ncbi:hypothetical protein Tco_0565370 [Tanacetum coccineum]
MESYHLDVLEVLETTSMVNILANFHSGNCQDDVVDLVKAKMISPEVESGKWRRLLLHRIYFGMENEVRDFEKFDFGLENMVEGLGIEDGLDVTERGYQGWCLAPQRLYSAAYRILGVLQNGIKSTGYSELDLLGLLGLKDFKMILRFTTAQIIMVNVFPPDHVDDLPDLAPAIPEPALVDENEEPEEEEEFEKEEEFEEEEPQEEEEDMEVDIGEQENEPELIFPYEEVDPLNPPPPASDSESEDVIKVEDTIEPEDETVPNSVHAVGESSTATFLREDGDSLFPSFIKRDINSLFGPIASLLRRVCVRETAHALVEKKGNAKDKYYGRVECKKLKRELKEAGLSNTLLHMQNEQVERDLYCTRVLAHGFYQEMICRGVVFEERPSKAIDVLVKDENLSHRDPLVTLSSLVSLIVSLIL